MKKELLRPLINAIFALFLIILIRIVAMGMLKKVDNVYLAVDIALSIAVIVVLLKFMKDFNRQLEISSPNTLPARRVVSWLVLLLVILTLYGAFSPFSEYLPYGSYHIIFFILVMIPVYSLWNILYRNTGALTEYLRNISIDDEIACSCGWKNPLSARFCSRCGSPLQEKGSSQ